MNSIKSITKSINLTSATEMIAKQQENTLQVAELLRKNILDMNNAIEDSMICTKNACSIPKECEVTLAATSYLSSMQDSVLLSPSFWQDVSTVNSLVANLPKSAIQELTEVYTVDLSDITMCANVLSKIKANYDMSLVDLATNPSFSFIEDKINNDITLSSDDIDKITTAFPELKSLPVNDILTKFITILAIIVSLYCYHGSAINADRAHQDALQAHQDFVESQSSHTTIQTNADIPKSEE